MAQRPQHKNSYSYSGAYIDGNTVRRTHYAETLPREQTQRSAETAPARKKRTRALQMSRAYVLFLTGAAAAFLLVTINYLQLRAEGNALRSEIASLQSTYSDLKLENDENYARVQASVDLSEIKETAINRLGMIYASTGQIITYDEERGDYVKQYQDVPTK